jgi:translation initiation factor 2 subunit 2
MQTYTTSELINRAYFKLKELQKTTKKTFIKPEITFHNRKTYIINFIKYCESIDREPEKVKNFLEKDMGAMASIVSENSLNDEKSGLKFSSSFKNQIVMNSITNYMKEYVLCKLCKSGDTEINKIDKITYLCCNNCKSNNAIL